MTLELTKIWDKILGNIKEEIGERAFENWFQQTKLSEINDDCLTITVPSNFLRDWIYDHYRDALNLAILHTVGKVLPFKFEVRQSADDLISRTEVLPHDNTPRPAQRKLFSLNPLYTFEGFVVGSSNRFAHAATMAIAESPAKAYNPLFIYGGVGLGKTHLMHAACHYIGDMNKNLKPYYISSETFTNELINAIRNRSTSSFREKYRKVDVLLIDDIQFIAGKEPTQEEFFHTFNALYESHKQIVLTSDRPPKTIPGLEERLVSRFECGLVTDIQLPDLETRIAILKKKAEKSSVRLPEDVLFFIAEKVSTNIRELEGALIRVVAYSSIGNKPITLGLATDVLKDILSEQDKHISVDNIQKKVAIYFDIRLSDMKAKKRSQRIAYPRQVAMYITRELTKMTLPEIGESFGGRDHSTVIFACDKINKEFNKNQNVKNFIQKLILEIKS